MSINGHFISYMAFLPFLGMFCLAMVVLSWANGHYSVRVKGWQGSCRFRIYLVIISFNRSCIYLSHYLVLLCGRNCLVWGSDKFRQVIKVMVGFSIHFHVFYYMIPLRWLSVHWVWMIEDPLAMFGILQ